MKTRNYLNRFANETLGAAALEYAVMASLIVIVSVGAIRGLSATMNVLLDRTASDFGIPVTEGTHTSQPQAEACEAENDVPVSISYPYSP